MCVLFVCGFSPPGAREQHRLDLTSYGLMLNIAPRSVTLIGLPWSAQPSFAARLGRFARVVKSDRCELQA